MRAFLDLLDRRGSFVLSGHENPDGDCVGAQVALFHLLRARGRAVRIVNPDPPPPSLDFLAEHTPFEVWQDGAPAPSADVLVLLDCAWLSRLGALGAAYGTAPPGCIAVVDHHVGSDDGDGAVSYVDVTAPSTGAMILRLYRELDVPLPAAAAEGVFVSLVADTGWFRYSNTTVEVFAAAAELTEAGVEPSRLYDLMFRRNHPDSVDLTAETLAGHQRAAGGRFGYAVMERAAVERASRCGFDTDMVMDPLRSVRGVEVVALFKELYGNQVKLSLRATGDVDVQAIAARFGGGGHKKAAGAQVAGPLQRVVEDVRAAVVAALGPVAG